MQVPTLPEIEAYRISEALVAGEEVDVGQSVEWIGTGDRLDLAPIRAIASELERRSSEVAPSRVDDLEGEYAVRLFEALRYVPIAELEARGLWRYLSLVELWRFIAWRHAGTFIPGNEARYRVYISGNRLTECVPARMYLRGRISVASKAPGIANLVSQGGDLWRSHILRVVTAFAPLVAKGLVEYQAEARLNADDLRDLAKRLNRAQTNVVSAILAEDAARNLVANAVHRD